MALVRVERAVKVFRAGEQAVRAVDGVSLEWARGEFSALMGPSGSGKTTLLNLIGGLERPDAGEVWVGDTPLSRQKESVLADLRLHRMGFVFQSYNLLPVLTAYENIELILRLQRVPGRERPGRIRPLFRALGLEGLEDRRPPRLSGGQQQRVAVARALVGGPELVLADEPTANLDSETAGRLLDLMKRLNQERGVTFLFSTHDPAVMAQARRIIRLKDGKVQSDEATG